MALLTLLLACTGKDDDTGPAGTDTFTTFPTPFDSSCDAQLMRFQTVCECSEIDVDWSGITHDAEGDPVELSDVKLVHWYVIAISEGGLANALCGGLDLTNDIVVSDAITPSGTSTTFDIGEGFDNETGIIALYDSTDADANPPPFMAGVFSFEADETNNDVVVTGRGDVWTGP